MRDFDFSGIEVLTFDCYGTLIDWEAGILDALRTVIRPTEAADDELLEAYAAYEAAAEAGAWRPYREILASSMAAVCAGYGHSVTMDQQVSFGGSVARWPAFPDSAAALARLRTRFELGVITNCDDDLFAASNAKLGEQFRWIVTAQQARSYKPSHNNFEIAFERIGRPRESILHVAQSLYHDHVPAHELGLRTVWINRRGDRSGAGATPPATAQPDLSCPDMATFAAIAVGEEPG
jgi:2-haloacid dehalogenase